MSTDPNRLEHCLERRGAQRFELHLPLAVHFDGRTVPGFAQNLSGGGIFFYHALGNHFGGKHAGSVSWAGVARRRLFPRRSANRDRRATRFLSVLALRRAHLPIRASFGREWRRSDFRPDTALRRFRGLSGGSLSSTCISLIDLSSIYE